MEQHGGTWMWVNPVAADLERLSRLVDERRFRVEVARTFPLEDGAEAFRLNMVGHTRGKIIVKVDDAG